MRQIIDGSSDAMSKLVNEHTQKTKEFEEHLENKLILSECKGNVKVVNGPPSKEIVSAASDVKADLIIMASRGVSGIRRTVIGSVSDHVIHESEIPVLIVKQKI